MQKDEAVLEIIVPFPLKEWMLALKNAGSQKADSTLCGGIEFNSVSAVWHHLDFTPRCHTCGAMVEEQVAGEVRLEGWLCKQRPSLLCTCQQVQEYVFFLL